MNCTVSESSKRLTQSRHSNIDVTYGRAGSMHSTGSKSLLADMDSMALYEKLKPANVPTSTESLPHEYSLSMTKQRLGTGKSLAISKHSPHMSRLSLDVNENQQETLLDQPQNNKMHGSTRRLPLPIHT